MRVQSVHHLQDDLSHGVRLLYPEKTLRTTDLLLAFKCELHDFRGLALCRFKFPFPNRILGCFDENRIATQNAR